MSGLVRRPHFEEVLDAAIKDRNSTHGILSVGMQRFATEAINNPLYQRVRATLEGALEGQERNLMEAKIYDQNLQRASMEAKAPKADVKWVTENLNPPPPPQPPPPPDDTKINHMRVAAEMDAVMQKRAFEQSARNLATEIAQNLARQSNATPMQQIIREHHHHIIHAPIPAAQPARSGKSVHEQFLEKASSSGDIPMRYFPTPRPTSTEFPDELMRPQVVPRGSVKQLADKIERPAATPPPRPPAERTGSVKQIKTKFEKPKESREKPTVVEAAERRGTADPTVIREAAVKHMVAIGHRANHETTKNQNFAKRVEAEKKKRRGGAPGDVVSLGKRKQPEPDMPRSILRNAQPESNKRPRVYGQRTQVFDMTVPAY